MFQKIMQMEIKHQVIFAVIIGFSVISFWRGAWGLMDLYLFPDDYHISLWISIIIGILILIITNYVVKELM